MTCETATDATIKLIEVQLYLRYWNGSTACEVTIEMIRPMIGGNKAPFRDRYEAFFIDYSLTPLLIQQNYIDSGDDHDDDEDR